MRRPVRSVAFALILAMPGEIVVHAQPAQESDPDTAISARVMEAMAREPALKKSDIVVRTQAGTVYLIGTVASFDDIRKAASAARAVHGVKAVTTRLRLEDTPSRA